MLLLGWRRRLLPQKLKPTRPPWWWHRAAFDAALLIASSVGRRCGCDAALTATLVATAVSAVAIKLRGRRRGRSDLVDLEVSFAAEAVRAVASAAGLDLAKETDVRAAPVALT